MAILFTIVALGAIIHFARVLYYVGPRWAWAATNIIVGAMATFACGMTLAVWIMTNAN